MPLLRHEQGTLAAVKLTLCIALTGGLSTSSCSRVNPTGSVFRLPARVAHFQATGSTRTVIQI
jgi:hypothetical protein